MRSLADLLHEALRAGDEQGLTQVRRQHLPADVAVELEVATYEHALAGAAGVAPDGWLTYREGIEGLWRGAAGLTKGEFGRVFHLRTDVVKQLAEQGLVYRP